MKKPIIICPYCGKPAIWVSNAAIYGHAIGRSYMIWWCKPCGAYVGCHENTTRPLGTLANKELREARMQAHKAFDPLWKTGGMGRRIAYAWLSGVLGKEAHIAESDLDTCAKIIAAVQEYKERNNLDDYGIFKK